jgi:hypothetical protein
MGAAAGVDDLHAVRRAHGEQSPVWGERDPVVRANVIRTVTMDYVAMLTLAGGQASHRSRVSAIGLRRANALGMLAS